MAIYDKKRRTWTASVMIRGKRYRKRGFLEKKFAETWEAQKRYEEKISVGLARRLEISNLSELFDEYFRSLKGRARESHFRRERKFFLVWEKFFKKYHLNEFKELDIKTIQKFKSWRESQITTRGEIPAKTTINAEMAFAKRVFSWLMKTGQTDKNPFSFIDKFKVEKKEVLYMTQEQISLLLDRLEKKNKALKDVVIVFLGTGMRSGELRSLTVGNVDLNKKVISLDPKNTKAGYRRIIPIQSQAYKVLKNKCMGKNKDDLVFLSRRGTGFKGNPLNEVFSRHCAALDMSFTLHDLRRTYISHMIMAGIPVMKVMGIVGHKNFETMKKYLHLSPKYLGEELDVLPF